MACRKNIFGDDRWSDDLHKMARDGNREKSIVVANSKRLMMMIIIV